MLALRLALVEQSETLDAQAAEATYQEMKERFPELNIGLVHGSPKRSAFSITIMEELGTSTPTSITVVAIRSCNSLFLNACIRYAHWLSSLRL
jgi:hypothetical protein